GALQLAPADDLLIQIEKPLSLDPLIIPSVLAKKKVVGSKYVVIDIPEGPEAKVHNRQEAEKLAENFIAVGKKLGMKIDCVVTKANQPLGMAIGPALEAREALETLMNPKHANKDLIDKATSIAGLIFKLVDKGDKKTAEKILFSGRAERKFREIIAAQGGNPKVNPAGIGLSKALKIEIKSKQNGIISYISNKELVKIAKLAGAPKYKLAGILLRKKLGDKVTKGETLFIIHSEIRDKLKQASTEANKNNGYSIFEKRGKMVIEEINKGVKRYE
ncbi:MAG: thymidine phosphorylase, partial [Candidatus Aenigmatarchaeota archaeon]